MTKGKLKLSDIQGLGTSRCKLPDGSEVPGDPEITAETLAAELAKRGLRPRQHGDTRRGGKR